MTNTETVSGLGKNMEMENNSYIASLTADEEVIENCRKMKILQMSINGCSRDKDRQMKNCEHERGTSLNTRREFTNSVGPPNLQQSGLGHNLR
ncbi:hypothetical protein NPIL_604361 [Nephila pilipes]|uniref:Uncharacterized protein n=1 Tax=Nephila pilipes TaxID=299642 RepID=A0A8X6QCM1_NEPPI|nr:hypothetical protein NPIL_604361 [Nephila pilipes]